MDSRKEKDKDHVPFSHVKYNLLVTNKGVEEFIEGKL